MSNNPSKQAMCIHGHVLNPQTLSVEAYCRIHYTCDEVSRLTKLVNSKEFVEWTVASKEELSLELLQQSTHWRPSKMCHLLGWEIGALDKYTAHGKSLKAAIWERLYRRILALWERSQMILRGSDVTSGREYTAAGSFTNTKNHSSRPKHRKALHDRSIPRGWKGTRYRPHCQSHNGRKKRLLGRYNRIMSVAFCLMLLLIWWFYDSFKAAWVSTTTYLLAIPLYVQSQMFDFGSALGDTLSQMLSKVTRSSQSEKSPPPVTPASSFSRFKVLAYIFWCVLLIAGIAIIFVFWSRRKDNKLDALIKRTDSTIEDNALAVSHQTAIWGPDYSQDTRKVVDSAADLTVKAEIDGNLQFMDDVASLDKRFATGPAALSTIE